MNYFFLTRKFIVFVSIITFILLYHQIFHTWDVNFFMHTKRPLINVSQIKNFKSYQLQSSLSYDERRKDVNASFSLSDLYEKEIPWWEVINITVCDKNYTAKFGSEVAEYLGVKNKRLPTKGGHCGLRASLQGVHQKLVSFSVYGDDFEYYRGLPYILNDISNLYPGWNVRIHTNPRGKYKFFCPLLKKFPNLAICDVTRLPTPIGDISSLDPMLWRSAPMGDDQVDRFVIRDSDAKMIPREAAAVQKWELSGKYVHLMRDNPSHNVLIMGGLLGIYQPLSMRATFEKIRQDLFVHLPENDQHNLERVMPQSFMDENALQHSSFWCTKFGKSLPFPTQRQHGLFVGNPMYRKKYENNSVNQECPLECRPAQRQDWLFC